MTWLLAVCVPGLMMLTTFGLQRLESGLHTDRTAADEAVAEDLRRAEEARKQAPPRPGSDQPRAVEIHRRLDVDEPGLPTRSYAHARPNPQFHRTRYANPV
ncbi:hypothetical protein [Candidatus Mycolicibacterium alkanivorans]|uniref:Secreted protein n=1 Tax=Candidatus Mycolicibacterium alkanivorans TaxID=2954114 RepID=A0ABS9YT61_9MYCO|nr:hypothetical protein [Candidatus Mycolicibacterium alkanivorans]MCI4674390.1 hypothetical protein [Candidatus Mycolicibacterium alkanivorans]